MSEKLVVGVDLGGTHAYAGIVNTSGEILLRKETDIDRSLDSGTIINKLIIPTIKEAIRENPDLAESIKAVGMGLPGSIDAKMGICNYSPNLDWHNVRVTQPIEEALGIPVYILNDARTAAMGEKFFGAGRGVSDFVVCAIGTGIGGGIVTNNELLLGDMYSAGEIGHITIFPDGYQCNCGNLGCMEAYASGPNIARRGREAMLENKGSVLWRLVNHLSDLTAQTLFQAAKQGDTTALKVWEDTGKYLGIGFANITHTVNPKRFIMGGRVSRAMEFFLPTLRNELKKRASMVPPDSIEIVPAKLEENAGLIGSASLAFERMGIL
jgi:glucokinase